MPAGAAETLASYRAQTRRLLHDANADYWQSADLLVDINKGIAQRDLWSGGSRAYKADVPLQQAVEFYSLPALFPNDVVLDIVNIWLIYGNTRVPLSNPPFSDLTNWFRPIRGMTSRPGGWSRYGATQVCVATAAGGIYALDWDVVTLSAVMVNDVDADPLPFPYTEPVPYYATYQALLNAREFDKADVHYNYFVKALRDIEGSRVGTLLTVGAK